MQHGTLNQGLGSGRALGATSRRSPARRVASLASGAVVAVAMAIVGTPALAAAAATPGAALRTVLTATPALATVGQTVLAQVAKSTVPTGDHVAKITLSWGDGTTPVALSSLGATAGHAYRGTGAFTITARITDAHGATSTATSLEHVTLAAGSYAGALDGTGDGVSFYVSTARTAIQDVTIGSLSLSCSPGGSLTPVDVSLSSVPLTSTGSFAATVTEHGVVDNGPATYVVTFAGRFAGLKLGQPTVSGTVRETASYVDGVPYHCTSGAALGWTTVRGTVQTVTSARPPTGRYSGAIDGTGDGVAFYVSNDRGSLQDLSIGSLTLGCSPGTNVTPVDVSVDSVPITSTGSFASTTVEHGVEGASPATYTITFDGNFHGFDAQGVALVAGSVTETVTDTSGGVAHDCTSGPQLPWTTTRDVVQTVTTGAPPAGSYSGAIDGTGDGVDLYVSTAKTALQDVTVGGLTLACATGGSVSTVEVSIDSVPLSSAGSFRSTSTQDAVYAGSPATYVITFAGNAHGLDAQALARLSGSVIETLTYDSGGTTRTCTSGPPLPWSASRDALQTVTTGPAPAGAYAGALDGTGDAVDLSVPAGGASLEDLTVGSMSLSCAPAGSATPTDVTITSVPVTASGSFDATSVQPGTYKGSAATYTITVVGSFHGLDRTGHARAAGSVTETMTSTSSGSTVSCSSGAIPWTVAHA